jgi:hypothetical protein
LLTRSAHEYRDQRRVRSVLYTSDATAPLLPAHPPFHTLCESESSLFHRIYSKVKDEQKRYVNKVLRLRKDTYPSLNTRHLTEHCHRIYHHRSPLGLMLRVLCLRNAGPGRQKAVKGTYDDEPAFTVEGEGWWSCTAGSGDVDDLGREDLVTRKDMKECVRHSSESCLFGKHLASARNRALHART